MGDPDRAGLDASDLARLRELAERAGGSDALIRADRELRQRNRHGRDVPIAAPAPPAPAPVEPVKAERPCLDLGRRFARMMRRR